MNYTETESILRALSEAPSSASGPELEALAQNSYLYPLSAKTVVSWGSRCGLLESNGPHGRLHLTETGEQYLELEGQVSVQVLNFLPKTVPDLHARRALLMAGADAVATFRGCLLNGTGVEHALDFLPPPSPDFVDLELALGLYAASAAVVARLSAEEATACLAEDIVLINLIDDARKWLLVDRLSDLLEPEESQPATRALAELLRLVRDPVLPGVFASRPLLDALGIAAAEVLLDDYPPETFFLPYPGAAPTGHLDVTWR